MIQKVFTFLLLVTLFFTFGCGSSVNRGLKPRTLEEYYPASGVAKYFLSDIPDWANFSQSAGCFRSRGFRYFDLNALMKSYSYSYADALQVQALFNEDFLDAKIKSAQQVISLKDEELLFFKASDKVNNKIYFFNAPTFKQIHLIWLDEALLSKEHEGKLRTFLLSSVHDNGVPILISACLSKAEIEKRFPGLNSKVISAELFSIYDKDGEKIPSLHLNIDLIFNSSQQVIFYSQSLQKALADLKGKYKIANY